jgi:REP element-mobilizing transposase RayT
MPKGLKLFYGNGDLHFITSSCYHREPLLGTARRRNLCLKVLEQVRKKYEFVIVGYVVMPEHFHLLISEPQKANPRSSSRLSSWEWSGVYFPLVAEAERAVATSGYSKTFPRGIFGSGGFTTSMCGARASAPRSSATSTVILSSVD